MITVEIIILTFTHLLAVIVGIFVDRLILQRIRVTNAEKITVDLNDVIRVFVLLTIFMTALASIIHAQFFNGNETSLVLTLGGAYSFGSLIGEGDFFRKLFQAWITKK